MLEILAALVLLVPYTNQILDPFRIIWRSYPRRGAVSLRDVL